PGTDSWSPVADMLFGVSAAGVAVLDGKIYVVGGCRGDCAPSSTSTQVYDPASDTWTQAADYPTPVTFESCAGIAGELVCAGGLNANTGQSLRSTYVYNPGSDTWTQTADMPVALWGSAYGGANDKLQVATGTTGSAQTNQAFEYDPSANAWSALPNANNTLYRGGGACGMYQVGGGTSNGIGVTPRPFAEVLPGYDQCGTGDVLPWLKESSTEFDLAPGQSTTVTVTADSSTVPQPGAYTGRLVLTTDTPYRFAPIGVTMQVNPPKVWGLLSGTVAAAADGSPIAGATVQITGAHGGTGVVTFTVKTDAQGYYQLWLDSRYDPLQVIAAKDGYQPLGVTVKVKQGATLTTDFALKKS
ncbi:MAG: carboxypeptidase regulatory-like domain-containing protein, partial [Micromonosporaceae bacterium]|nr:carboxypeptidase regulatory-like domain-containing protein [Micromonosporaceae bacterium]